jgi:hypothetical protein
MLFNDPASSSSHFLSSSSAGKRDMELEEWQQYTLDQIFKERAGAKKTLPVLNMQSRFALLINAKSQKTYYGGA